MAELEGVPTIMEKALHKAQCAKTFSSIHDLCDVVITLCERQIALENSHRNVSPQMPGDPPGNL